MNESVVFSLIVLLGILPLTLIIFYFLFRRKITFYISVMTTTAAALVACFAHIVGVFGLKQLVWCAPSAVACLAVVYFLMYKRIGVPLNYVASNLQKMSNGDLCFKFDNKYSKFNDEIGIVSSSFEKMVNEFCKIVGDVKTASSMLLAVSGELSKSAQEMSQVSSEQATSFEEVHAAIEQIVQKTQTNSQDAEVANNSVSKSVETILLNNESVQKSIESLKSITQRINVINDISFQTNILSLNAAIEAARAGNVGKGFSVVANEVGKLAERSKESANEISTISEESSQIAGETTKVSARVIPEIQNTAKLISGIVVSSKEQERSALQVNTTLTQLNSSVHQLSSSSEETASSAEELASQAEQLNELVSYFKLENN